MNTYEIDRFLIAYKKNPVVTQSDDILEKIIDRVMNASYYGTQKASSCETEEDLDNFILEHYHINSTINELYNDKDPHFKNVYNQAKKCLDDGYVIVSKLLSESDFMTLDIVSLLESDNFIVLDGVL